MVNLFHLSSATLTNQDGSEDKPTLVYDAEHNVLSFTHDVNRNPTVHPVVRIFSFLLPYLRLITVPVVHLPFRLNVSCNIIRPYPLGYEHFFLGLLVLLHRPSWDHDLDIGLFFTTLSPRLSTLTLRMNRRRLVA